MLDFYLIESKQANPSSPGNLEYVGGIDFFTFQQLVNKKIIDARFDYYSDFRWTKEVIEQMIQRGDNKTDTDLKELNLVLAKAVLSENELFAFCD